MSCEHYLKNEIKKKKERDFPGDPVIKTLPSNAGGVGLIPGQGTKIPYAVWCSQNRKIKKKISEIKKSNNCSEHYMSFWGI